MFRGVLFKKTRLNIAAPIRAVSRKQAMRLTSALGAFALAMTAIAMTPAMAAQASGCAAASHQQIDYIVCRFDPAAADIRLFLNDASGAPLGHFNIVNEALAAQGEQLVFAMNAGMYHKSRKPVGLFVEEGTERKKLSTKNGPGNFHLKPNGVFLIDDAGAARVQASATFNAADQEIRFATQSGPMLVIDGKIHPRFLPDSDSLKRRNGVGVTGEGEVIFVLADTPVRFYDFAIFFRDVLKTPNALYLDGTISRLYAPELGRNDPGAAMGPIVGVVAPLD